MFKSLCLDTGLDRGIAGRQAVASSWGFTYRPLMVPFKQPVELGGWVSADAALNVGIEPVFNKYSQCGLTVAVAGRADIVASEDAMSKLLGASRTTPPKRWTARASARNSMKPNGRSPTPQREALRPLLFVRLRRPAARFSSPRSEGKNDVILVNKNTKVITQGMTGETGTFHTQQALAYGTQMVGGVTPGKGGTDPPRPAGVQHRRMKRSRRPAPTRRVIYVPPPFAADSILRGDRCRSAADRRASPRAFRCSTWSRSSAR